MGGPTNQEGGHGYGVFRPASAPARRDGQQHHQQQPPAVDDPRHHDDSPMPWLRYFFPKEFDLREGANVNPYYQFFDVMTQPLEEDLSVPPPPWVPNAYYSLSFTTTNISDEQLLELQMPKRCPPEAVGLTKDGLPLFAEKAEAHYKEVVSFCRVVCTFKARTWKDAFPLVDLLRGMLLYLLDQMAIGQRLAVEYAQRDARLAIEREKERMAEEYAKKLAAEKAAWEEETERRIAAAREQTRKQVSDEFAGQLKAEREEKERWAQKATQLEAQVKRLNEAVHSLERQVEQLREQMDSDKGSHAKALADKERLVREAQERAMALEEALARARKCIVEALKAKTKDEVIAAATNAMGATLPGAHAYVAELRPAADADKPDPASATLQEYQASLGDPQAPAPFSLGFLHSPLGAAGASAIEELKPSLVFKYVKATHDHAFMVGQKLPFGQGVSWSLLDGAKEVSVPEATAREGLHFFRPPGGSGSYFAAPLIGSQGEVVGLVGVDTVTAGKGGRASPAPRASGTGEATVTGAGAGGKSGLGSEERAFVNDLAAVISSHIAKDQDAYQTVLQQQQMLVEEPPLVPLEVDPSAHADLSGGMKMFREALDIMKKLGDDELDKFRNKTDCDEPTLAVLRAILRAVGDLEGADDWEHIRPKVTRELIDKLHGMDIKDAWAEWQNLCQITRPVFEMEANYGKLTSMLQEERPVSASSQDAGVQADFDSDVGRGLRDGRVGKAMGKWMAAVRMISAANAMRKELEAKLAKANQALMKTFAGDGSSSLVELRSYRVPPRITFHVLQAVLLLTGLNDDDAHNWGKMRVATNYKTIRKLTELKPGGVSPQLLKKAEKLITGLDDGDVKKESMATLALYRWLENFTKLASVAEAQSR